MGLYAKYVLAKLIDKACGQAPMAELRSQYVPHASGRVLEIGLGSGHNLPYYTAAATSVTAIDPATEVTELAAKRISDAAMNVELISTSAESIPFDDGTFDTVVSTWTLCSIPDVERALAELRRVIRPEGKFLYIEHGLSPDASVQRWQRRIEPVWKRIGGGCHLTRDARTLIAEAGFTVNEGESSYSPGPRWAAYTYRGVARPG